MQSTTHPTRKDEFKQLLRQIPEIERVLKDPAAQQAEAEEAKRLRAGPGRRPAQRPRSQAQLDGAQRGPENVTPNDVKSLAAQSGGR